MKCLQNVSKGKNKVYPLHELNLCKKLNMQIPCKQHNK